MRHTTQATLQPRNAPLSCGLLPPLQVGEAGLHATLLRSLTLGARLLVGGTMMSIQAINQFLTENVESSHTLFRQTVDLWTPASGNAKCKFIKQQLLFVSCNPMTWQVQPPTHACWHLQTAPSSSLASPTPCACQNGLWEWV